MKRSIKEKLKLGLRIAGMLLALLAVIYVLYTWRKVF